MALAPWVDGDLAAGGRPQAGRPRLGVEGLEAPSAERPAAQLPDGLGKLSGNGREADREDWKCMDLMFSIALAQ